MHHFQPYPIDLLEINPFTKIANEWMLVAAGNQEKVNALTASWAVSEFFGERMLPLSLSVKADIPKNS